MSLLMDALKKAERSKQEQKVPHAEQSGQPGGVMEMPDSVAAPSPGLSLLPQEVAAGHADTTGNSDFASIIATQEKSTSIPDLDLAPLSIEGRNTAPARVEPTSPTLELALNEPPAPVAAPRAEPEAQPQPATSAKPGASIPPAFHAEAPQKALPQDVKKIAAAQQKAKIVFAAKQPTRSRTLLLTGTAVAVVLGLVGFGVYYWQITSTSTIILPASTPQPTHVAAPVAPAMPADAGAPQLQGTPAASAQTPIDKPVLSPVEACPEPYRRGPAPVAAPASPPAAAPAVDDSARAEARRGPEPFKANSAIRIQQSAATSQLNPILGKAYQSFLSGDTGTAQQLYHKALQQEPNNRDALLGLAAIALKQKQAGQAAAYYGKLLELDPTDPEALAALIGLQGQTDPTQSESRLKKALAQNPQADAIHFALGNLYTQQSRWAEAQQSYFRAYSSAPGNADYAFNLAVSLDHLNQSKLALDYYQRALAQTSPANFDKPSAQLRIQELLQPAGN